MSDRPFSWTVTAVQWLPFTRSAVITWALHAPVTGVVYDSVVEAPLANAIVQMVSFANRTLTYAARTDSTGAFRIPSVQHGGYLIGFLHPALDSLGLTPPEWALIVGDSGAHAILMTLSGCGSPYGVTMTTARQ